MHSFVEGDHVMLYDGDYNGDVIIRDNKEPFGEVTVPATLIKAWVANYIRSKRISKLEQMSDQELLN